MIPNLTDGIVRILASDNYDDTAGTGFVVTGDGLIVTCAHVVKIAKAGPGDTVFLVFYKTKEKQKATVDKKYWRDDKAEDIAILRLEEGLPEEVKALPLGSSFHSRGHTFSTFGFPKDDPIRGMQGQGEVLGSNPEGNIPALQLKSGEVDKGFSGAPIWDDASQVVIGMVISSNTNREVDISIKKGDVKIERRTFTIPSNRNWRFWDAAFARPIEVLREVCPELQVSSECPYRELVAFREADAHFFYGRDNFVETTLLKRLHDNPRFLAILGPSGSGKSSVVQAGLIPKLREGRLLDSESWEVSVTRPSDDPFQLRVEASPINSDNLAQRVSTWLEQHPEQTRRFVLVVDQFEELLVIKDSERSAFIAQLTHLLDTSTRFTLITVMRNDFYSQFVELGVPGGKTFGQRLNDSNGGANIPRTLTYSELKTIIRNPAERANLRIDDGLVDLLAKDAIGEGRQEAQSTILPLLEYTLVQLWKKRHIEELTLNAYREIHGIRDAFTSKANMEYDDLIEKKLPKELPLEYRHHLVRRIFMDLVHISVGDENQQLPNSRQRKPLASLYREESELPHVQYSVDELVNARLLVKNEGMVEIIHDVLLNEWGYLKSWVEANRKFLIWRQKLDDKIREWEMSVVRSPASKHDEEKLLRGRDLEEALDLSASDKAELNKHQEAFINKSWERRQQEVRRQRRVAATMRGLRIVAAILLLVALAASVVALIAQSNHLKDQQTLLQDQQKLLASLPVSVTNLNDHGTGSLRDAIAQAPPGGAITFAKTLKGTIRLTSRELKITKNLTISGPGAQALAISGSNTTRVFNVSSGLIVNISNVTIRDGFTTQRSNEFSEGLGGGIYNDLLSTLTLVNVIITNNGADFGGGIYNHLGILTLTNSTISHNTVRGDGGGIDNEGTLTITNSTVAYNTTAQDGGGIKNRNTLLLTNSTIAANTATGTGGGIFNTEIGSSNINYSTIYGNTAQTGGGITIESGTGIMEASIVAGNGASTAPDISGTITLYWPSLIQNTSGTNFSSGPVLPKLQGAFELGKHSILDNSPLLGPLQDNGGQTQTYALLVGSPAIDQILPNDSDRICGTNSFYPTDQRGKLRPQGVGCDLGAYEYAPS